MLESGWVGDVHVWGVTFMRAPEQFAASGILTIAGILSFAKIAKISAHTLRLWSLYLGPAKIPEDRLSEF